MTSLETFYGGQRTLRYGAQRHYGGQRTLSMAPSVTMAATADPKVWRPNVTMAASGP